LNDVSGNVKVGDEAVVGGEKVSREELEHALDFTWMQGKIFYSLVEDELHNLRLSNKPFDVDAMALSIVLYAKQAVALCGRQAIYDEGVHSVANDCLSPKAMTNWALMTLFNKSMANLGYKDEASHEVLELAIKYVGLQFPAANRLMNELYGGERAVSFTPLGAANALIEAAVSDSGKNVSRVFKNNTHQRILQSAPLNNEAEGEEPKPDPLGQPVNNEAEAEEPKAKTVGQKIDIFLDSITSYIHAKKVKKVCNEGVKPNESAAYEPRPETLMTSFKNLKNNKRYLVFVLVLLMAAHALKTFIEPVVEPLVEPVVEPVIEAVVETDPYGYDLATARKAVSAVVTVVFPGIWKLN
jgi:hypothetical protein